MEDLKNLPQRIRKIPVDTFTPGRKAPIRFGVIHFVSCKNMPKYKNDPYSIDGVIELFTVLGKRYRFSVHDFIGRDGEVLSFVDIKDTAWAVGKSFAAFPDYIENINYCSYSVELAGMKGKPYTSKQYETLGALTALRESEIEQRGLGHIENYLGHDWISGSVAVKLGIRKPGHQKVDPGRFDWALFHKERLRVKLMQEVLSDSKEELRSKLKEEMRSQIMLELTSRECLSLFIKKVTGKK